MGPEQVKKPVKSGRWSDPEVWGREKWEKAVSMRRLPLLEDNKKDIKIEKRIVEGGGSGYPHYAVELSRLLNKYSPKLIGITNRMVAVNDGVAYGGAELAEMFKGFGDAMKIKNIVYDTLADEGSYAAVEELTKGRYKIVVPSYSDDPADRYFRRQEAGR